MVFFIQCSPGTSLELTPEEHEPVGNVLPGVMVEEITPPASHEHEEEEERWHMRTWLEKSHPIPSRLLLPPILQ